MALDHLEALTIRDVKTGASRVVDTCALFIMVGAARTPSGSRAW